MLWTILAGVAIAGTAAAQVPAPDTPNEFPSNERLSAAEVRRIVRQAVAEAEAQGASATIAVTDRVGNVLAVYGMDGTGDDTFVIDPGRDTVPPNGLNGANIIENRAAAIAKAITGAYLSSNGNAFSSRTASQIVQENFNPGSTTLEGGPLFGVQFSSLPCSDLVARFESNNGGFIDPKVGPKRSPLGLSADPGGLPLYDNGTLVGAIGVIADGEYGLDRVVRGVDRDLDEIIAFAGTRGFMAPQDLEAERVHVDGRALRFADAREGFLASDPDAFRDIALDPSEIIEVPGYFDGTIRMGQAFGFGKSGYRPDPDGIFDSDHAYVLTDAAGVNRFPPTAGSGADAMTAREVRVILEEALGVALQARGLIRRPLGSNVEVTISVVDRDGTILGIVRTPDAPVFGTDVSLQKARTALLFTRRNAPDLLRGAGANSYVRDMFDFLGDDALGAGISYSTRAIGSIARPFYPDGRNGGPNGPLSLPFESWSPFNTGIQLDLIAADLVQHVLFVQAGGTDVPPSCTDIPLLANGAQIFSGGYTIHRGRRLIGAIGISGDGIDQDAMVAFLGVARAAERLGTGIGNAPKDLRASVLVPLGVRLRYVSCPYAPFVNSDEQLACQGL